MHALIVVAHPEQRSHTHAVAAQIGEALLASGGAHTFEVADLAKEGFDPRFNQADIALYSRRAGPAPDVAAEHARLDRADAVVLVFPIYWWGMPALLNGWIVKKLGRLDVHLVAIGGADERTYARHGYFGAMKTQINHGIFDFCGAPVRTAELLLLPDAEFPESHYATARAVGEQVFAAKA